MLFFQLLALAGGWAVIANLGGEGTHKSARNTALGAGALLIGVGLATWLALQ